MSTFRPFQDAGGMYRLLFLLLFLFYDLVKQTKCDPESSVVVLISFY